MINLVWWGYCCRSSGSITSCSCCLWPSCTLNPLSLYPPGDAHLCWLLTKSSHHKKESFFRTQKLPNGSSHYTHSWCLNRKSPSISCLRTEMPKVVEFFVGFDLVIFLASFGIRTTSTKLGKRDSHMKLFFPEWNTKKLLSPEKHVICNRKPG